MAWADFFLAVDAETRYPADLFKLHSPGGPMGWDSVREIGSSVRKVVTDAIATTGWSDGRSAQALAREGKGPGDAKPPVSKPPPAVSGGSGSVFSSFPILPDEPGLSWAFRQGVGLGRAIQPVSVVARPNPNDGKSDHKGKDDPGGPTAASGGGTTPASNAGGGSAPAKGTTMAMGAFSGLVVVDEGQAVTATPPVDLGATETPEDASVAWYFSPFTSILDAFFSPWVGAPAALPAR